MICALPFLMLVPVLPGVVLNADDIMCRVAENQQRAQAERAAYVYDMNIFVKLQRPHSKLAREESRDYTVAPTPAGAVRELRKLEGTIQEGDRRITYTDPKFRYKGMDVDGEITESFANDLLWKKDTNYASVNWFPITRDRMEHASFRLEGEELYHDYPVYRIAWQEHDEHECWTGEALIEKTEFQPVLITTAFSCKLPAAVKILLGTNVTRLGAKISYQRFAKDVWFPVTCGGEMKLRVLFLYSRTIAFSARNTGFRKTDVQSAIEFNSPK